MLTSYCGKHRCSDHINITMAHNECQDEGSEEHLNLTVTNTSTANFHYRYNFHTRRKTLNQDAVVVSDGKRRRLSPVRFSWE